MFAEREYILSENSKHYIYRVLTHILNKEDSIRGNARTVRNMVEDTIRHHAQRVIEQKVINKKEL